VFKGCGVFTVIQESNCKPKKFYLYKILEKYKAVWQDDFRDESRFKNFKSVFMSAINTGVFSRFNTLNQPVHFKKKQLPLLSNFF